MKTELNTKADLTHIHEQYALKTELDSKADKLHQHTEYSLTTHQHPEYSLTTHQHSDYATKAELFLQLAGKSNSDHTHDGLWTKKQIVDLIDDETGTPWYEKLFKGLEVINEVAQDGYIYWLQSQINTIYGMLAANGIADAAQSISGLGAVVQGVASKFSSVANALDWVGEKFPKLQSTISKITSPLRTVANHISGYQKIIDNVFDTVDDMVELDDFAGQVAHHIDHVGTIDDLLRTELLPDTVETVTNGTIQTMIMPGNTYYIDSVNKKNLQIDTTAIQYTDGADYYKSGLSAKDMFIQNVKDNDIVEIFPNKITINNTPVSLEGHTHSEYALADHTHESLTMEKGNYQIKASVVDEAGREFSCEEQVKIYPYTIS